MPSEEQKLAYLVTLTSHATAYLGPILLKQGQSPASVAKLMSDYSLDCYSRLARECGMINPSKLAKNTRSIL